MVFHSPHAGQRPIHLGLSLPQLVQYHKDFAAAMNYLISAASTALKYL